MAMADRPNVFERFNLQGRTALITGGSKGIGKGFAFALLEAGAEVMIAARGKDALKAAQSELKAGTGREPHLAVVDLYDRTSTEKLAKEALDRLGHVDIFIANAAVEHGQSVDGITDEALDAAVAANLASSILLTRALVPSMKERGWGRVIYLSSVTTSIASADGHGVYSATKAALEAFARVAAIELGPHRITVNTISPGVFYTEMAKTNMDQLGAEGAEAVYRSFAEMTAFGRWGDTGELEGAALLLASDAGSYITGSVLHVDGGLSIKMRPMP